MILFKTMLSGDNLEVEYPIDDGLNRVITVENDIKAMHFTHATKIVFPKYLSTTGNIDLIGLRENIEIKFPETLITSKSFCVPSNTNVSRLPTRLVAAGILVNGYSRKRLKTAATQVVELISSYRPCYGDFAISPFAKTLIVINSCISDGTDLSIMDSPNLKEIHFDQDSRSSLKSLRVIACPKLQVIKNACVSGPLLLNLQPSALKQITVCGQPSSITLYGDAIKLVCTASKDKHPSSSHRLKNVIAQFDKPESLSKGLDRAIRSLK